MTDKTDRPTRARFSDLVDIMAHLRSPRGCPWDREQDHRSLRHCLLEEAYEVLEAVDREDADALPQELGDLLLQVLFHSQLAAEAGEFTIDDVIQALHDKLVSRHPHVFGDASLETAEQVLREWQALKHKERAEAGNTDVGEPPRALPALSRAQVAQRRAERAGIARSSTDARAVVEEALAKLSERLSAGRRTEQAVGELLFAVVGLARVHGVDAEQALRERVDEFLAASHRADTGSTPTGAPTSERGSDS